MSDTSEPRCLSLPAIVVLIAACAVVTGLPYLDAGRFGMLGMITPVYAVALLLVAYAPGRLGKKVRVAIGLGLVVALRLICDLAVMACWIEPTGFSSPWNLGATVAMAACGLLLVGRVTELSPLRVVGTGFAAAFLFFLISNFGVWRTFPGTPDFPAYEQSLGGLVACYAAALPFFRATLVATVTWTAALFTRPALSLLCRPLPLRVAERAR